MFRFVAESDLNEFLGFLIDTKYFCINVREIEGVIYVPSISKIPNVPSFIEGAINLRGKIIRIINLRKWFRLPWKTFDRNSRIIIINLEDNTFGILVDDVHLVFTILKSDKHEIPFLLANQPEISFLKSIILQENHIFLEIDPEKIRI